MARSVIPVHHSRGIARKACPLASGRVARSRACAGSSVRLSTSEMNTVSKARRGRRAHTVRAPQVTFGSPAGHRCRPGELPDKETGRRDDAFVLHGSVRRKVACAAAELTMRPRPGLAPTCPGTAGITPLPSESSSASAVDWLHQLPKFHARVGHQGSPRSAGPALLVCGMYHFNWY